MLWNLAFKDIEQNRKALAVMLVTSLALPLIFGAAVRPDSYLSFAVGYGVVSVPILFAHLFVGHEKLKGTFRLLCVLPVRGSRLIKTKALATILLGLLVANLLAYVEPLLLRSFGLSYTLPGLLPLIWINVASAFVSALAVSAFVAFEHKVALQVSYLTVFGLALGLTGLDKWAAQAGLGTSLTARAVELYLPYWGVPVVLLFVAASVRFAGRLFELKEWPELEEG